jgi:mono/diheme cytochrome c family protein
MRASLLSLLVVAACHHPVQRGEPAGPPVAPHSAREARGEVVFDHLCYKCHPGGEQGLGVALNDKPLPSTAIRFQIRTGAGAMPKFSKHDLSDDDLDAVVSYVRAMRKAPARY